MEFQEPISSDNEFKEYILPSSSGTSGVYEHEQDLTEVRNEEEEETDFNWGASNVADDDEGETLFKIVQHVPL